MVRSKFNLCLFLRLFSTRAEVQQKLEVKSQIDFIVALIPDSSRASGTFYQVLHLYYVQTRYYKVKLYVYVGVLLVRCLHVLKIACIGDFISKNCISMIFFIKIQSI